MKIKASQLRQHLGKPPLQSLYVISGDEPLLTMESCDHVRLACKTAGYLDREVHHADTHFDWQSLLESANSLSLFGDKKLVEIRQEKPKFDDATKKALLNYLEKPNPDTVLLFIWPKLEKAFIQSKWFQTLETIAVHVQIWPMDARELPQWIEARMRQAGLQPTQEAVKRLCERVEGNLLAAAQEIEKLKLLASSANVDADTVESVVADHSRYDVFALVDIVLDGNIEHALHILQSCKATGEDAGSVLWAFCRDVRTLHSIHTSVSSGMATSRAIQNAGVWEKRKPLFQKAINRLDTRTLNLSLGLISNTDRAIKGWSNLDPWQGLSELAVCLSGKPGPLAPYVLYPSNR